MDDRPKWTVEQLELLEMLRSHDEAADDPALAAVNGALNHDPDLSRRLEQILGWDDRISNSIRDVPVPPALAEQILHSLDVSIDKPSPVSNGRNTTRKRRPWLAVALTTGVAAVVLTAAVLSQSLPTMTPETLRSMARDRFVADQGNDLEGAALSQTAPPVRFPYSADLHPVDGMVWRSVAPFDRAEAVVYDIPLGTDQKATLYVVRCRSSALPQRPPRLPQLRTLGLAIAAWQADGVVYIAVVESGANGSADAAYRYLLKSSDGPLA